MAWLDDSLKLFLLGTCWFSPVYSAVQLLAGHFSGRVYQFSEHLELDLLDA